MRTATGVVQACTLSEAWLQALVQVSQAPGRKLFHTVTRITDPTVEDGTIRAAADELLVDLDYQPVETVANTIFPEQVAASSRDTAHLVARYLAMYPTIRRIHKDNQFGTYFGRVVEYPTAGEPLDQLTDLIRKIDQERAGGRPKGARYEVPIHTPDRDRSPMHFPCLSLCSFQLDRDRLHLSAHYRSQYLVQRGYGNYLGLARLQAYVAAAAGIEVGQLLVVAGLAHADAAKYRVASVVKRSGRGEAGV
jgi:thymidylate synthase